ncbi:MAG: hypothetical protein PHR77_21050 [Kiritimatiellae bacterium]|nr:hypothetical protein [Kiritimatiellia bacterium]MDD5519888.1 hypothetical protein [Kiritimatiellia bacterium]
MSVYKKLFKEFRVRLIVGFGCFLAGIFVAGGTGGSIVGLLVTLPFIFLGAIVIAPAITAILAQPFSSLFYPSDRFDGPQPMYSVPQAKRAKGLYEEAMTGYEKIASRYPKEVKPYIEMIDIAIMNLRNVERAKSIVGRGIVLLGNENDKKVLKEFYNATITRLELKPEWLKKQEDRPIIPQKIERTVPVEEPDGLTKRRFHPGGYVQRGKDEFDDPRSKVSRKL